jgi:N-acetylmuramoyl-L-alanine amidase
MKIKFLFYTLLFCLGFPLFGQNIVIDPGHGGMDLGAVTSLEIDNEISYFVEKEINLVIADQLFTILQAEHRDWVVFMTRIDNHTTLTSDERFSLIQNDGNDTLVISIHLEYSRNSKDTGFSIYYNLNSILLAGSIVIELESIIGEQIPLKEIKYDYMRTANKQQAAAFITINCGFINNAYEATLLSDPEFQKRFATGIALGIEDYLRK